MEIFCVTQGTQTGLRKNLEGWDGVGGGKEVQEEGTYVYLWLFHVDVWQKSNKFCKVIIVQLNKLKKKERNRFELGRRALELSFNPTGQPRGDSESLNPASVLGQRWKRGLSEFLVPLHHFWPELSYPQPFLVRRVQQKCWLGDEVLLQKKKNLGKQQIVASASLMGMLGFR